MNKPKLITALLLMLPSLSWGTGPVPLPKPVTEPSLLALLGAGGVIAGLVWFIRRRK
jgi:hypothetical protein